MDLRDPGRSLFLRRRVLIQCRLNAPGEIQPPTATSGQLRSNHLSPHRCELLRSRKRFDSILLVQRIGPPRLQQLRSRRQNRFQVACADGARPELQQLLPAPRERNLRLIAKLRGELTHSPCNLCAIH
jgi:hypothetical protein